MIQANITNVDSYSNNPLNIFGQKHQHDLDITWLKSILLCSTEKEEGLTHLWPNGIYAEEHISFTFMIAGSQNWNHN